VASLAHYPSDVFMGAAVGLLSAAFLLGTKSTYATQDGGPSDGPLNKVR